MGCGPLPDADPGEDDGTGSTSSAVDDGVDDGIDDGVDDDGDGDGSGSGSGGAEQTDTGDATDGSGDGGSTGGSDAAIEWQPCPVFTGGEGAEAECATVDVPADWADPAGESIELFVKRIGAMEGDKQLWMLMGGPGGSARSYESSAATYTQADPGLTVYLLDHRGTGRSTLLECPSEEAAASEEGRIITLDETPACLASLAATYGDTLAQFNTTNAAFDLGWLVDEVRQDEAVHVFGSSYGTYWAQRYLHHFGDQPDSVTLLGIAEPALSFTTFDPDFNDAGLALMADCGDDPTCSAVMGADPAATMAATYAAVEAGQCAAAGLSRDTLRTYFSFLVSFGGHERSRIPATLHRLQRCNAADVTALQNAAPHMQNPLSALLDDPLFSVVINRHISLSEMWSAPFPSQAEIDAWEDDLLFTLASSSSRFEVAELWPTYAPPPEDDVFAETDVPILMLNGEFDPNTPLPEATLVGDHFTGPNQRFFVIPGGNHGWHSPTTEGYGCAENMFFNFIQDPTGPRLDCLEIVEPIQWAGTSADAQTFFGTDDLYD
ncbi:MAG: alpha/beta fold hydrolase [Myxococcota bacterium]